MRLLLAVAFPFGVLFGAAHSIANASESSFGAAPARADDLVRTSIESTCGEVWRSWPTAQSNAMERGTVMVFDLVSRVGKAFLDLRSVIEVSDQ